MPEPIPLGNGLEAFSCPSYAIILVGSKSNPGTSHTVFVVGELILCSCRGFVHRGLCRHVDLVTETLVPGQISSGTLGE